MTHRKKDPIIFNDQYVLGYWSEYAGTFSDNVIDGLTFMSQSLVSSFTGAITLSAVPNRSRILLASKVYGFCNGESNIIADFETNSQPYRVFRLHEFKELKENFRYSNPQRFIKLYNNSSVLNDGTDKGVPVIIDSQVPQPPNYILALNGKLSSQWSVKSIYGMNNLPKREASGTCSWVMFEDELFKLYPPFSYNFVDAFVNKIWANIQLSESRVLAKNIRDPYCNPIAWFDEEDKNEVPYGNHFGLGILPITTSMSQFVTNPTGSELNIYRLNSTTKGPVNIGLGHADLQVGTNIVSTYHQASHNSTSSYLDVVRDPTASYFTIMGSSSTRNFIFYNTGIQPNLCEEWLYSYPNEHKFKALERLPKPKRYGNTSWGAYDNAKYSVQGWEIPEWLTEKDSQNSINDLKLGTIFWKFDSGIARNKYFPSSLFDFSSYLPLPITNSSNVLMTKGVESYILTTSAVLSPTIVLADFFGTPSEYNYKSFVSASSFLNSVNFPLYPKLKDMYDENNINMQFSLSFSPTYPRIQDVYKAFYGFGDGVSTVLSEYATDSVPAKYAEQKVFTDFSSNEYAHRKRFIWGKDKIPSFKHSYQFLHSMTYAAIPLPVYEMPVTFAAFTGSNTSSLNHYPFEPEIINVDQMNDFWPLNGSGYNGPKYEKPLWWEGPYVVGGPMLRGYKYGLFDCLPRVPTAIFRRDKFGNFRDMLEQRQFFATKYTKELSEVYPVTAQFVVGSDDEANWKEYNSWQVGDPEPTNNMDAGLYELHSRVGKPFNESGWV